MEKKELDSSRHLFLTSFEDKNGQLMREGDYTAITETLIMNNHYYDGYDGRSRDPYKEYLVTGTVIYLI